MVDPQSEPKSETPIVLKVFDVKLDEKDITVINHLIKIAQLQISLLQNTTLNETAGDTLHKDITGLVENMNKYLLPKADNNA